MDMKMNDELGTLLQNVTQKEIKDFLFVMHGTFTGDIVSSSIGVIEKIVKTAGYSPQIVTKVKMISIEIMQNIKKHQYSTEGYLPYFVISSSNDGIVMYAGNVVSNDVKLIIGERLNVYQSIDPKVMKDFYIESLKNTQINVKSNASIGLLDIVYRSNQNIKYDFKPIQDNLSFFGLEVYLKNTKN
jgi:hypothetical protein